MVCPGENAMGSSVKKELNILFTCAGRRVVLIKRFRDAMQKLKLEGKFIAADISPLTAAFKFVDRWEIVPKARNVEYIPHLLSIVEKHRIGLIVPLTDLDLRSLARQADAFKQIGCTVMVGDEPSVRICRDKQIFCQHVAAHGLPAIKTFTYEQFLKDPFFPCFVKPMHGSAGIGATHINIMSRLVEHVKFYGDNMLVQSYVPGREYTIDVYKTRSGKIAAIVPRQRLVVRGGEVEQGITVKNPVLIDAARKLVETLPGLWGCFCCQCRWPEGDDPYFFEINPRFGGGVTLSIAAGANIPYYLIQDVLGMKVNGRVGHFTENLALMRYNEDIYRKIKSPDTLPGFDQPVFHE